MEKQLHDLLKRRQVKLADAGLLSRCAEIAQSRGMSAEEWYKRYTTFSVMKELDSVAVSASVLDSFRDWLAQKSTKGSATKVDAHWNAPASWDELGDRPMSSALMSAAKKPRLAASSSSPVTPVGTPKPHTPLHSASHLHSGLASVSKPTPSPQDSAFKARTSAGQVAAKLNEHVAKPAAASAAVAPPVKLLSEPLAQPFRYLEDKLPDRAAATDRRIRAFGTALASALKGEAPSHPVGAACQAPALMVGRIVVDSIESEGSLNEASVLLEGCGAWSGGARCRLDLSQLPHYRLFPGQVVGVRGVNLTQTSITAHELYASVPLHRSPAAAAEAGASIVMAAGPFTTAEDLTYEPLQALLEYCRQHQPGYIVLAGPFVDVRHPTLAAGLSDRTFHQIYCDEVLARLQEWQAGAGYSPRIVLLPALRDAHHAPVFPHPPLPTGSAGAAPADGAPLLSLPNPSTFSCGGVTLAAVTYDALLHLSAAELSRPRAGEDRLAALAGHIVGQRCLYPLYPPPVGSCLDASLDGALRLAAAPDVLLLPSDLSPFAKLVAEAAPAAPALAGDAAGAEGACAVEGAAGGAAAQPPAPRLVVCVNPGRLAKGAAGGTFAHVWVAPGSEPVEGRTRVEVIRI